MTSTKASISWTMIILIAFKSGTQPMGNNILMS